MKRYLWAILTAVTVLGLAACEGTSPASQPEGGTNIPEEPETLAYTLMPFVPTEKSIYI